MDGFLPSSNQSRRPFRGMGGMIQTCAVALFATFFAGLIPMWHWELSLQRGNRALRPVVLGQGTLGTKPGD